LTVIRTDLAPADTELDAMEMDLLAEEATDRDRVVPGDIEIEDADGCDASAVAVSRATETLMRRTETEAVSRIGGLEVRGVGLTIEQGWTLLDNVSFSARPGTLTAVIGPSGAGKSTLAKVMVGATRPTRGAVSFEGHDIHGGNVSRSACSTPDSLDGRSA